MVILDEEFLPQLDEMDVQGVVVLDDGPRVNALSVASDSRQPPGTDAFQRPESGTPARNALSSRRTPTACGKRRIAVKTWVIITGRAAI
jgi:hypothetical protein